ncbi:hypothetical protein [Pseudomonas sp. 44 R 15]|nr:hypothetical protein [Pseudomonas sp. 44 R 15]
MFAERLNGAHHLFAILAVGNCRTNGRAPHSQRLARTRDLHLLITAKRRHGPVQAGQSVLRSGDGDFTFFNLLAQMFRIVQQGLPINLPRLANPRPILRATPAHKRLPPITVRLDRAVMPAAKQVPQCMRPGIAQLPTVAKIASISPAHQCHDQTPPEAKSLKLSPRHPATNVECYQGSRPLRPVRVVH